MGGIVVSGFEPFGGRTINASYAFAQALAAACPGALCREIPVVWGEPQLIVGAALENPPDLWIACGEAPDGFRLETRARNLRGHRPDNLGALPHQGAIVPHGPDELSVSFPAALAVSALQERGYACRVSDDAGSYLCEEMLYSLLLARKSAPGMAVIFIHVPLHGAEATIAGRRTAFAGEDLRRAGQDFAEIIRETTGFPEKI